MNEKNMILLPLSGFMESSNVCIIAKSISKILSVPICILHVSDEIKSREAIIAKLKLQKEDMHSTVLIHKTGNFIDIVKEESKKHKLLILSTRKRKTCIKELMECNFVKIMKGTEVPILFISPHVELKLKESYWKPEKALIPISGKPGVSKFLKTAINILKKTGTSVDILHIARSDIYKEMEQGTLTTPFYEDYQHYEWEFWKKEFLQRFCPDAEEANVHLTKGNPAREILNFAKKYNHDLIIMIWKGDFSENHAMILKEIIMNANCPVLINKIH